MASTTTTSLMCRLIVGHSTTKLDKPTEEGRTHSWKIFVKSLSTAPKITDRSFVRKVTFHLHESYAQPVRKVRKPPFEIGETAYGSFPMKIIIEFAHVAKPFTIGYELQLFMQKKGSSEVEFKIQVDEAPPEFVEVACKYGAKILPTTSGSSVAASSKTEVLPRPIKDKREKKTDPRDKSSPENKANGLRKNNLNVTEKDAAHICKPHKAEKKSDISTEQTKIDNSKKKLGADKEEQKSTAEDKLLLNDQHHLQPKEKKSKSSSDHKKSKEEKKKKKQHGEQMPRMIKKEAIVKKEVKMEEFPRPAVLDYVQELAKEPVALISPIGNTFSRPAKDEIFDEGDAVPSTSKQSEQMREIEQKIFRPIPRDHYRLPFLHEISEFSADFISRFEREIPLVEFDEKCLHSDLKRPDNRRIFERNSDRTEPQIYRFVRKKRTFPF